MEGMTDATTLADRYVAVWNEPDPTRRRAAVEQLWSEDASHTLQPPQEIRTAADALGVAVDLEARGHAALEDRVTKSHHQFVQQGGFVFRPAGDAARLRDMVKLRWEMVPRAGGDVAATGLQILLLDADGRIRLDYQFIES
jgi:hypothetical protein